MTEDAPTDQMLFQKHAQTQEPPHTTQKCKLLRELCVIPFGKLIKQPDYGLKPSVCLSLSTNQKSQSTLKR